MRVLQSPPPGVLSAPAPLVVRMCIANTLQGGVELLLLPSGQCAYCNCPPRGFRCPAPAPLVARMGICTAPTLPPWVFSCHCPLVSSAGIATATPHLGGFSCPSPLGACMDIAAAPGLMNGRLLCYKLCLPAWEGGGQLPRPCADQGWGERAAEAGGVGTGGRRCWGVLSQSEVGTPSLATPV